MTNNQAKLKHEIWGKLKMEKIPEFRIIEKKLYQLKMLSKKQNIHLFEKLHPETSDDFMKNLEYVILSNKRPKNPLASTNYVSSNNVNFNNNIFNNEKQSLITSTNFPSKDYTRQITSPEGFIQNKTILNSIDNNKNNSKDIFLSPQNIYSSSNVDNNNINNNNINESSEEIVLKSRKKVDKLRLDLMKPLKGNFSHSLKYYNNNEFLSFINKKFDKDTCKINEVLKSSKLTQLKAPLSIEGNKQKRMSQSIKTAKQLEEIYDPYILSERQKRNLIKQADKENNLKIKRLLSCKNNQPSTKRLNPNTKDFDCKSIRSNLKLKPSKDVSSSKKSKNITYQAILEKRLSNAQGNIQLDTFKLNEEFKHSENDKKNLKGLLNQIALDSSSESLNSKADNINNNEIKSRNNNQKNNRSNKNSNFNKETKQVESSCSTENIVTNDYLPINKSYKDKSNLQNGIYKEKSSSLINNDDKRKQSLDLRKIKKHMSNNNNNNGNKFNQKTKSMNSNNNIIKHDSYYTSNKQNQQCEKNLQNYQVYYKNYINNLEIVKSKTSINNADAINNNSNNLFKPVEPQRKAHNNKFLDTLVIMKKQIEDSENNADRLKRANSANFLSYISKPKHQNPSNTTYADEDIYNSNQTCNNLKAHAAGNNKPNKNHLKSSFNNPEFYISEKNFKRNLKLASDKNKLIIPLYGINRVNTSNDGLNNNKNDNAYYQALKRSNSLRNKNLKEKKNQGKKNGKKINSNEASELLKHTNIDLEDLILDNNNKHFVTNKKSNSNSKSKSKEKHNYSISNKEKDSRTKSPNKHNIKYSQYTSSNSKSANKPKYNLESLSEERDQKLLRLAKINQAKIKKSKKLKAIYEKIRRMNSVWDDEKYSQITPFIRTNVFSDDLTYEQVFRGIKTFELSHTRPKYRKNIRNVKKLFQHKGAALHLVRNCNRKIRVYSKSIKRKIRKQNDLTVQALIARKKANEGIEYNFKRRIRSQAILDQKKYGIFIYSYGKGYNIRNFDRLYSSKYKVRYEK